MQVETRVYLGVFDFGSDPAVVTELMGVPPTQSWVKGEHYDPNHPTAVRTHSRWMLASGLAPEADLQAHLRALLERLRPLQAQVLATAARFEVSVGVAQNVRKYNLETRLDAETIRGLAELGVWLRLDQYFSANATDS